MPTEDQSLGLYVPTTNIWDIGDYFTGNLNNDDIKELLIRLYQNMGIISNTINLKTSGLYPTVEFVTGDTFFPNPALNSTTAQTPEDRSVFRVVIDFGALPNTATKSVAHNIDTILNTFSFTKIYATASDQVALSYIPIPYASSVLINNIEIYVDATNVNIKTAANYSMYTKCYVVVEYIKS